MEGIPSGRFTPLKIQVKPRKPRTFSKSILHYFLCVLKVRKLLLLLLLLIIIIIILDNKKKTGCYVDTEQLILKMECLGALLEGGSAEFLHPDLMVRSLRPQRGAAGRTWEQ